METASAAERHAKPQLYGLLKDTPVEEVVSGVHYAARLLRHRRDIPDVHQGFRVPGVASEPTDADERLALRLIDRIEQAEQRPVQVLSDGEAAKYIVRLASIARRRERARYGHHPERGRRLLEVLRSQELHIKA